ncbi:ABC transporter ATP-binding protein [Tomitella fengzijianii]|uniref:ABC transporter ATP-binding protein n=1 Tax=Tomitella fengzijianii TaxID=2597660 RepID=A0A516X2I1_9ACTN|nr:ABC transporter ATP-binding protein [Tomitella fengzijianii]QDQ97255.1 ABC transporter ATP-binding protein [Tomitella fengzijianii]
MARRGVLFGALAMSAGATIMELTFPLLTRSALDDATAGRTATIAGIAAAIAALACVRWACMFGRRVLAGRLSLDVQHDLRLRLLSTVQKLDGRAQDRIRTGQVVSRSITDLQLTQGLLAMFPMVVGSALQFVLAFAVMAYLSPLLTVVALAVAPCITAVAYVSRKSMHAATWSAQQGAADLAQHVEETVTGVRVVKGFGQESRMTARIEGLGRTLYARRMRAARVNARFAPALAALPQLGLVAVIALGGWLALQGSLSIGTFLAFATYITRLSAIARIMAGMLVMVQLSRAAAERVFGVIDARPTISEPDAPADLPDGPVGVEVRGVDFAYTPGRPVFDGLDLTVQPGQTLVLVGPTGSGKSALAQLLDRFYDPDSGTVAFTSGTARADLRNLALHRVRETAAVVFDEPFLFSDSIAANIALGRPAASDEEIRAAAVAADADEFIAALPDGYATTVGERGLTLSGGQRQRIALARAILQDPRLLVLDDATSAVDAETEARIFAALRAGRADRTTIVIAHRRSTLALADRIAVLDGGRIVDAGTEAELLARSGLFRELIRPELVHRALDDGTAAEPRDAVDGAADSPPDSARLWPRERESAAGEPLAEEPGDDALGTMAVTPELRAALAALPPATEDPRMDDRDLRAPDLRFRLRRMLAPVAPLLALVALLVALDTAVGLSFPIIVRYAIDHGVVPHRPHVLYLTAAGAAAIVAVNWVIVSRMTVLTARAGERLLYELRVRSYSHLQRLGLDYYEKTLSGRIMTRMTTDVDALSSFLQTGLSTAIVAVLTIIGVLSALLATDLTLGLVALCALPPLIAATVVFRRISSAAYTTSRERVSAVNADFQENITGLRTTQSHRREQAAAARFTGLAESYRSSRMRAQVAISVYFPLITLISDLVLAAIVFVGAKQVAAGTTSAGTLAAFVLYLGLLFGPVQQLSQVFDGYQQARVGLRRIGELLRTPTSILDPTGTPEAVPVHRLDGAVALDGVDFRYAPESPPALTGVDLTITPGSTVALVGRTGAGKSTIVKLIARFYDATSGTVRVGGTDIRRFPLHEYRGRLGVVPQEAHLFTGTVADNIAFGMPDATRDRIEEAARAVGALHVIAGLDGGMLHPVGERGQGLSAGQRQLVALARAELVDPDVLLLDEATATLDPVTEFTVLAAGRKVRRDRTAVLVAHRLATAEQADEILVIDDGRIVERGAPQHLRTSGGHYARLLAASGTAVPART